MTPDQDDINRQQGRVNAKQGDLNDAQADLNERLLPPVIDESVVGEERQDASESRLDAVEDAVSDPVDQPGPADRPEADQRSTNADQAATNLEQEATNVESSRRADVSEAAAAVSTVRRDAEHADQAATNLEQEAINVESSRRADVSEADAARVTVRRDAEHAEQGDINVESSRRADVSEAATAVVTVRRDAEHADQEATNAAAVEALNAVRDAATKVTALLRRSAARSRRWTAALACVVVAIAFIATLGFFKFRSVSQGSDAQRRAIAAQTMKSCEENARRTENLKRELTFLVTAEVRVDATPEAKAFAANYPAHLERVIPPVDC